jgi:hypothetical protein
MNSTVYRPNERKYLNQQIKNTEKLSMNIQFSLLKLQLLLL